LVLATFGVDLEKAREALRRVDITGTSDEQPEDAGRRQMVIRVAEDGVSVEATDPTLIGLAQKAIEALGDQGGDANTIRGDSPTSVSLGNVWSAIEASLGDITRRATAATSPASAEPESAP
jgi:hypothetical protein